jgi:hypothetical protein
MSTLDQKISISAKVALFFAIASAPFVYGLTGGADSSGCPTIFGRLLHTLIFAVICYLSMWGKTNVGIKLKHTWNSAMMFFFISSPEMYSLVGSIIPGVADSRGCPTNIGIALHTFVYFLTLIGIMFFPDRDA